MTESADSPCIAHCSTALGDNVCRGCFRTFMEVAQWSSLAPEGKRDVWGRLQQRRHLGTWAGHLGGSLDLVMLDDREWAMIWYEGFAKLLFRFEVDGSLCLCLPDSGLATNLNASNDAALLEGAKRWLADCNSIE